MSGGYYTRREAKHGGAGSFSPPKSSKIPTTSRASRPLTPSTPSTGSQHVSTPLSKSAREASQTPAAAPGCYPGSRVTRRGVSMGCLSAATRRGLCIWPGSALPPATAPWSQLTPLPSSSLQRAPPGPTRRGARRQAPWGTRALRDRGNHRGQLDTLPMQTKE